MRTTPAAAVQKGDTILVNDDEVTVTKIENSTPVGGRITWNGHIEIGAATRVEVVRLG